MEHLDENTLTELLERRMPEAERARIEAHLDVCAACLELVALVASASPSLEPTEPDLSRHLAPAALAPGDLVAGRFRLERLVGEGGMGVVWAALDERRSAERVAIKMLKDASAAEKKRFAREAHLVQALEHPGILDVREVVVVGDEADILLVMDLLAGESLGGLLGRVGRLSCRETLGVLLPLSEAAAAAHAKGIVHRDLKPENVFLCDDGRVVLLDFGMAKLTSSFELAVSGWMTESGLVLGTPHYMAPEQLYGERDVDARADVWALGVVAYECLSGERPVEGKSLGQILRALQSRTTIDLAARVPSLPPALPVLVTRMLSLERAARPTMEEVHAELARIAAAVQSPPAS